MQNQVGMVNHAKRFQCLDEMTGILSAKLGETKRTIAICGLVDSVLGICWGFEDLDHYLNQMAKQLARKRFRSYRTAPTGTAFQCAEWSQFLNLTATIRPSSALEAAVLERLDSIRDTD